MGSFTNRVQGADKRTSSSTGSPPESSHVSSAVPARLFTAVMYNGSASSVWFQVFDAASLPANGEVPIYTQKVLTQGTASYDFADGIPFTTGIVVAASSTDMILTLVVAAEQLFAVTHRKP